MERTGLRSPCTISIECRYSSPLAVPASFRVVSGFSCLEKNRDRAYETKTVNSGVS